MRHWDVKVVDTEGVYRWKEKQRLSSSLFPWKGNRDEGRRKDTTTPPLLLCSLSTLSVSFLLGQNHTFRDKGSSDLVTRSRVFLFGKTRTLRTTCKKWSVAFSKLLDYRVRILPSRVTTNSCSVRFRVPTTISLQMCKNEEIKTPVFVQPWPFSSSDSLPFLVPFGSIPVPRVEEGSRESWNHGKRLHSGVGPPQSNKLVLLEMES